MKPVASVAALLALALVASISAQQPRTSNPGSRIPNPEAREPIRIAYVFSDGNLPGTLKALDRKSVV